MLYRNLSPHRRRQLGRPARSCQSDWLPRQSRRRWRRLLILLGLIMGVIVIVRVNSAGDAVASLQVAKTTSSSSVAPVITHPTVAEQATYTAAINAILAANPDVIATVVTVNLKTGAKLQLGSDTTYTAASTAKLLTAATYFRQVEQGEASLMTVLSNGQTAQYNLEQMIVQSDNACWAVLNNYLTHAKLVSESAMIGMTQYDPTNNILTADDTAQLLQQLYNGTLVASDHRSLFMSWLLQANYREEIVAAVPTGYTVYHKVGVLDDFLHDAAIITKDDQALELVIYTNGTDGYATAARITMMHQITAAALQAYFTEA